MALRDVDRGFDPRRVIAFDTSLSGTSLQQADAVAAAVRSARQRLEAVPGIAAFAASRALPLEPAFALPFTIDRRPVNAPFEGNVDWRGVSPGYFDVFRIPVLRGRAFEEHDDRDGQAVVIVNAALARRYWQTNDPVGEKITIGTGAGPEFREGPRRIVGVVADPRDEEANRDPVPMVYVPLAQVSDAMTARNNRLFPLTWVVRTEIEPRLHEGPDRARAPRGHRRPPDRAHADAGGNVRRTGAARRVPRHADERLRGGRAAPGDRRLLRPDVVLGAAADAGDRHPHGARRGAVRRADDDPAGGAAAGRRGRGARHRVSAGADPGDGSRWCSA